MRPDKFSKEHVRTLSMLHETFARLATTTLSAYLTSYVHLHVASVDQLTYNEFIRSIPTPTTLSVLNLDPLHGPCLLEIDPAISFTIIDRLFGGSGDLRAGNHELTDIEKSVMENTVVRLLGCLREAWCKVIDLRPRLSTIETNPMFTQIVPPTETTILVTIETKICETEGMINLCLPYTTLEPIMGKLSANYWYSSTSSNRFTPRVETIKENINDVDVELTAVVDTVKIKLQDLCNIKVDDVIKLNNNYKEHMTLCINNIPKFTCRPGMSNKHLSVQIDGKVNDD
jgi:flagellar motor switch protein FliM